MEFVTFLGSAQIVPKMNESDCLKNTRLSSLRMGLLKVPASKLQKVLMVIQVDIKKDKHSRAPTVGRLSKKVTFPQNQAAPLQYQIKKPPLMKQDAAMMEMMKS